MNEPSYSSGLNLTYDSDILEAYTQSDIDDEDAQAGANGLNVSGIFLHVY